MLSSRIIASEPYSQQPPAQQKGSTTTLDSGDDRMQQVQFIGGEIWGALGTSVVAAATPHGTPHAGAAWFNVRPRLEGSKLERMDRVPGLRPEARRGRALPGDPGRQALDIAAMVFTLTGAHRFASSAYAVMSGNGAGFGAPIVSAAGSGPYDPAATRWGDYLVGGTRPLRHQRLDGDGVHATAFQPDSRRKKELGHPGDPGGARLESSDGGVPLGRDALDQVKSGVGWDHMRNSQSCRLEQRL